MKKKQNDFNENEYEKNKLTKEELEDLMESERVVRKLLNENGEYIGE